MEENKFIERKRCEKENVYYNERSWNGGAVLFWVVGVHGFLVTGQRLLTGKILQYISKYYFG